MIFSWCDMAQGDSRIVASSRSRRYLYTEEIFCRCDMAWVENRIVTMLATWYQDSFCNSSLNWNIGLPTTTTAFYNKKEKWVTSLRTNSWTTFVIVIVLFPLVADVPSFAQKDLDYYDVVNAELTTFNAVKTWFRYSPQQQQELMDFRRRQKKRVGFAHQKCTLCRVGVVHSLLFAGKYAKEIPRKTCQARQFARRKWSIEARDGMFETTVGCIGSCRIEIQTKERTTGNEKGSIRRVAKRWQSKSKQKLVLSSVSIPRFFRNHANTYFGFIRSIRLVI